MKGKDKITVELKTNQNKMSERDIRELKNRIEAMTPEELAIVAETIPVEYCLGRIHNEIDRARIMENKIRDMIGSLKR